MGRVAIVTDSTSNLPAELLKRYDISVVPVLLHIDRREYRDGVDITASEIYRLIRNSTNGQLPKTAAPSVGEFFRVYTQAAQNADEIISIHLSTHLSAVYQVAHTARELVSVRVHVVDSQTAAMGCGFAVLEAARLAQSGAGVDEILARTMDIADRTQVLVMLPTLEYLHRGGHVPAIASFAGSALQLCPILTVGHSEVRIFQLPRTKPRALQRIMDLLEQHVAGKPFHLAVMHADELEGAEELHRRICGRVSPVESFITEFTPVMGAHTGPGVIGVAYYAE